jgi:hypothetical protein
MPIFDTIDAVPSQEPDRSIPSLGANVHGNRTIDVTKALKCTSEPIDQVKVPIRICPTSLQNELTKKLMKPE